MRCFIRMCFIVVVLSLFPAGRVMADVDYTRWVNVLEQYVDEKGRVDYGALKENRAELDQFIGQLAVTDISEFSVPQRMAFWINGYNALTMQAVTDNYPIKSIRRIWQVWDKPHAVAQGEYSLNQIEHEILRPLGDPRVHFALNCASIGCPQLSREPFDPGQLDAQLNRETRGFINNSEKVYLDKERDRVHASSIFKWFSEDFERVAGDVVSFIARYRPEEDQDFFQSDKVSLQFLRYDWGLNDQHPQ